MAASGPVYEHICDHCGDPFTAHRPHAKTCGTRCRVAKHRKQKRKRKR